jgi:hypothetical protein
MDAFVIALLNIAGSIILLLTIAICGSVMVAMWIRKVFSSKEINDDRLQDVLASWLTGLMGIGFALCGYSLYLEGESLIWIGFTVFAILSFYGAHYFYKQAHPLTTEVLETHEELERIRISQADDDPDWKPVIHPTNPS